MTTPTSNAKMASEFIGTFFLTMTIFIAAVLGSEGSLAPFGIAATLMVMIYALLLVMELFQILMEKPLMLHLEIAYPMEIIHVMI